MTVSAAFTRRRPRRRRARSPRRLRRPSPTPATADIGDDGTFNIPVELTAGNWTLTITAASAEGKTTSLTRNVSVRYKGVNLVVSVKGGPAWMKVWVDGELDPRVGAGKLFKDGKTMTFRGDQVGRGLHRLVGRRPTSPSTGRRSASSGGRGSRRRGCSQPPAEPEQTNHR